MRRAACVLVFAALTACSSSGSAVAPTQIATSSTTAEEARAIDGLVMRYPDTSSTSVGLATLLHGVLQLDGDCLYLGVDAIEQRFPILWPAGTRWDGPNQSVVSPDGQAMRIGATVEGRGGYFYLSDVSLLAGAAAWNVASRCVDGTGQIAVIENIATSIGPTNG